MRMLAFLFVVLLFPPSVLDAQIVLDRSSAVDFDKTPVEHRLIVYCQMYTDSTWQIVAESCDHRRGVFGIVDTVTVGYSAWCPRLAWDRKRVLLSCIRFDLDDAGGEIRVFETLDGGRTWSVIHVTTTVSVAVDLQMVYDPVREGIAHLVWVDARAGHWDLYYAAVDSSNFAYYEVE